MNQVRVASGDRVAVRAVKPHAAQRSGAGRKAAAYFFPATAALFLVLTAVGFGPYFTQGIAFPGREIAPPLKTVIAVHAVVMSAWMIVLMAQPTLIFVGRHRLHVLLGKVGAVIALLVIAGGLWLAIRSVQVTPAEARIWGLPPLEFFIVPFTSVVIFGVFIALGIAYRRKPATHRVMMILGTLAMMSAPISRIDPLNGLYLGTVWERLFGPFFMTMVLALLLVAARWALTQKLDRVFAAGTAVLIVLSLAIWQLAPTAAWTKLAALFVS